MKTKFLSILFSILAMAGMFGAVAAFAEELDVVVAPAPTTAAEVVTSIASTGDHLFTIVGIVAAVAVVVLIVFTVLGKKH